MATVDTYYGDWVLPGRDPEPRAEIIRYVATVEPLLRRGATLEVDGRGQPAEPADIIERLVAPVP